MDNNHSWRSPSVFAFMVWVATLAYTFVYMNTLDIGVVSESFAFTGGILFGCSFALSFMTYFFNFMDDILKYRRELGLLGYCFALGHAITLVYRFPDKYIESFPSWIAEPESLLGLGAMSIFTLMAFVSFRPGMRLVGRYFRPILRLGYVAYGMLIVRAWIIQKDTWIAWFEMTDGLAPPRLLLSLFALTVIVVRIIMEISLRTSKSSAGDR